MKTLKHFLLSICFLFVSMLAIAQAPGAAKLELDNGKLDKAKEIIEKSVQDPKHSLKSKTWYYRGLIYAAIAGDATGLYAKLDDDPAQKALDSYKKAMELEPEKKGSYKDAEKGITDLYGPAMNFGIKCYNDKNLEGAVKAFMIGQTANPKDLVALVYGGELALELKKYDDFKASMEKLVALPLADFATYNTGKDEKQQFKKQDYYARLAFYYRDQDNNPDKAIEYCKNGLKEIPGDNLLQSLLMELYAKNNKFDDALAEAKTVTEKNPTDYKGFLNLGIIYEKLGKTEEAVKAYEKAVSIDPSSFDALYNLGAVYYNKGAQIMTKVNAMDLNEYNKKGKAEEELAAKEFQKAQPHFEKLYTMKPKEMQVLTPLSTIYRMTKQMDKAEKVMNEIKALGDN